MGTGAAGIPSIPGMHRQGPKCPDPGERVSAPADVSCSCLFCSSCVECKFFGSGPFEKNCSQACANIQLPTNSTEVSTNDRKCREKDSQNCWMSFRMVQEDGEEIYTIIVDPERGIPSPLLLPCLRQADSRLPHQGLQPDTVCLSVPQSAHSLPTSH